MLLDTLAFSLRKPIPEYNHSLQVNATMLLFGTFHYQLFCSERTKHIYRLMTTNVAQHRCFLNTYSSGKYHFAITCNVYNF